MKDADCSYSLRLKLLEEAGRVLNFSDDQSIEGVLVELIENLDAVMAEHGIRWDDIIERRKSGRADGDSQKKRVQLKAVAVKTNCPELLSYYSDSKLIEVIKRELQEAEALYAASAFYSRGMLNPLLDPFRRFTDRGGELRILTSVMNDFNNPDDLRHLRTIIPGIKLRVFYHQKDSRVTDLSKETSAFHVKGYLFRKKNGRHSLIVGSSNLTGAGLSGNHEWNYFSNMEPNVPFHEGRSVFDMAWNEFNSYWEDSAVDADDSFLDEYKKRWNKVHQLWSECRRKTQESAIPCDIKPHAAQLMALESLEQKRQSGISRTSVIAATGLGKTYLAAFDFKKTVTDHGFRNVLFIAHRENILAKALETYQKVLGSSFHGEILSGNSKPVLKNASVFASAMTLKQSRVLDGYEADAFDYIVIDEFHYAEAKSYQKIIDRFTPEFLLGMTATPERMDGRDVLKICNYDVAYECRLFQAVESGWLVPFQYYAIHDPTDFAKLKWTSRGYIDDDLDQVLINDTRAELIFNNLMKFLPSNGKIKALAFCSSRNHAEYMNRRFNELGRSCGMQSICLLGMNSIEERQKAMNRLQDETDPLQIICSVDIFGEGVDIPSASHVLFLRPTQSFTVFLQQLGRGLRLHPEKDFLIALDFVGNFKHSYVAQLALLGYTSVEEYRQVCNEKWQVVKLPSVCYVSQDTEVEKIRNDELEQLLRPASRIEALENLYLQIRNNLKCEGKLERPPLLMDFFANPEVHDPYVFLKHPEFGGNWLRVKKHMNEEDLSEYEKSLLDTPGEALLQHLEKEMHPNKSYKMVVLKSLLKLGGTEWKVTDIAGEFHGYYLKNLEHRRDWVDLERHNDPAHYPLNNIENHLMEMPLGKLVNTGGEFFQLERENRIFRIRPDYHRYWMDERFREFVTDRVEFGLARYFYKTMRKSKG
ncbi:MAG: DEAD/DEAH box helicase family protein [Candidatus Wallbacteria bacterium]|nr:DEAD/DEAH box helicase family protein [Candidatus Wallbacteria bacterium]